MKNLFRRTCNFHCPTTLYGLLSLICYRGVSTSTKPFCCLLLNFDDWISMMKSICKWGLINEEVSKLNQPLRNFKRGFRNLRRQCFQPKFDFKNYIFNHIVIFFNFLMTLPISFFYFFWFHYYYYFSFVDSTINLEA